MISENGMMELRKLRDSPRPQDEIAFEDAIARFHLENGPAALSPLFSLFDDAAKSHTRMFTIIHAAETFDDQTYVAALLSETAALADSAPRWLKVLYMRVLNSDSARAELLAQSGRAGSGIRDVLASALDSVVADRPEFGARVAALKNAIG
ncbi:MAG TPA: Imm30 family immunity protein [Terriglobales bacterium]|nr:Imm30 family immunity protein [Terriglobales bacterium]